MPWFNRLSWSRVREVQAQILNPLLAPSEALVWRRAGRNNNTPQVRKCTQSASTPCQTTEEHQADSASCCPQRRQAQALWNAVRESWHKELGMPKPQTCHAGSSPGRCFMLWMQWWVASRELRGYRWEAVLWTEGGEVPGEMDPPMPRGEGANGQVGQLCPENGAMTQERWWIIITLHLINDHLGFTCFRQSCSLKKGTGSWPAWRVLFEPSLFQWPANAEHLTSSTAFTLSDLEWMGRHYTVPWIYRNWGQRRESLM